MLRRLPIAIVFAALAAGCGDAGRSRDRLSLDEGGPLDPLLQQGHHLPSPDTTAAHLCPAAEPSRCATPNEGSVIRGTIRMKRGLIGPKRGRLIVALTRYRAQGEYATGGHLHAVKNLGEVDLSNGPVPFQIDSCDGGESAYVEDACEMNLLVTLDTNGNNYQVQPDISGNVGSVSFSAVPDQGEPAARLLVVPSCHRTTDCLDVVLDCIDGAACVAYDDPGTCACGPSTCNSDWKICTPEGGA